MVVRINYPYFGRYNHSLNVYQDQYLILFGGEKSYNETLNYRECLQDIWKFDTKHNIWKMIKKIGSGISKRRCHAACVVG